jgi:hypothetical protein
MSRHSGRELRRLHQGLPMRPTGGAHTIVFEPDRGLTFRSEGQVQLDEMCDRASAHFLHDLGAMNFHCAFT